MSGLSYVFGEEDLLRFNGDFCFLLKQSFFSTLLKEGIDLRINFVIDHHLGNNEKKIEILCNTYSDFDIALDLYVYLYINLKYGELLQQ